jgi:MFS family permease
MVLVGGGLGFWGWMVFGALADRVGRRPVGILCLICGAGAIIAFYLSHYLMIAFTALVFFESGITIAINALATELFPTHLRATAKAWVTNAAVLGAMCGLGLVGWLAEDAGGHGIVIAALALVPALLSPLLLLLPDTHRGDLETTSGERV